MKRLLACVSLVAATTTAALPAPTPVVKPTAKPTLAHTKALPIHVAPADEYFGKLKMSVLGIRNTIKDVGANLEIDQTRWTQLASKAAFAEDAMRDWEKKYPQDTWLAKMVFSLERMYAKLDSDEGRKRSVVAMRWLVHDFPASWYGKTGRKEFALGKVGRPPQTAAVTPSPSPSADQISSPAALPSSAPGVGTVNAASSSSSSSSSSVPPDQSAGPSGGASPGPFPAPSTSPGERPQNP